MSFELALLHLTTVPFILLSLYILRPGGAEQSYQLNYKLVSFLLPGKWKEKEYFVRHTKYRMIFWLILFSSFYLFGLWKLKTSVGV